MSAGAFALSIMRSAPVISFNAIDVETANRNWGSICQIGIVQIRDGRIATEFCTLVDPEEQFEYGNISIHGIDEFAVREAPTMRDLHADLTQMLQGAVVVSHTSFDKGAIEHACDKCSLRHPNVTWLDTAKVARRAWPDELGGRGYGLKSLADHFQIPFKHHDALEDARAAALILLRAVEASGLDIAGWLKRVEQPARLKA